MQVLNMYSLYTLVRDCLICICIKILHSCTQPVLIVERMVLAWDLSVDLAHSGEIVLSLGMVASSAAGLP